VTDRGCSLHRRARARGARCSATSSGARRCPPQCRWRAPTQWWACASWSRHSAVKRCRACSALPPVRTTACLASTLRLAALLVVPDAAASLDGCLVHQHAVRAPGQPLVARCLHTPLCQMQRPRTTKLMPILLTLQRTELECRRCMPASAGQGSAGAPGAPGPLADRRLRRHTALPRGRAARRQARRRARPRRATAARAWPT
jgi:hypothetical protein